MLAPCGEDLLGPLDRAGELELDDALAGLALAKRLQEGSAEGGEEGGEDRADQRQAPAAPGPALERVGQLRDAAEFP